MYQYGVDIARDARYDVNMPTIRKGVNDMANTITPEALAKDIGVSGKVVRAYLRRTFTRPAEAKGTTWVLDANAAKATREHFASRAAKAQA